MLALILCALSAAGQEIPREYIVTTPPKKLVPPERHNTRRGGGSDVKWLGEYIVTLAPGQKEPVLRRLIPGTVVRMRWPDGRTYTVRFPKGTKDAAIEAMAKDSRVVSIQQDSEVEPQAEDLPDPSDPAFSDGQMSYATSLLHMKEAWRLLPGVSEYLTSSANSARARVAVADSGVNCVHYEWRNSGAVTGDASAGGQLDYANAYPFYISPGTQSTSCGLNWADEYGHGTATTSTVASAGNGAGLIGGAWMLQAVPYRVAGPSGSGVSSYIHAAILQPITLNATLPAKYRVRAVNASFGPSGSQSMDYGPRAVRAMANDIIPVMSAGNNGVETTNHEYVCGYQIITVSGTDDGASPRGNYGPCSSFSMPYTVTVADIGGGIRSGSGTSFSSPLFAALVGLMWLKYPDTSSFAVLQSLQRSALDVGTRPAGGGWGPYSYGLADYQASLQAAPRSGMTKGRLVVGTFYGGSAWCCPDVEFDAGTGGSATHVVNSNSGTIRQAVDAGWHTVTIEGMPAVRTYVVPGADTFVSLNASASPNIVLKGRVTRNGQPVPYAIVQARTSAPTGATAQLHQAGDWMFATPADDQGEYELTLWNAGTYDLRASTLSGTAVVTNRVVSQTIAGVNIAFPSAARGARSVSIY